MVSCYACGDPLPERVYRNTTCESCGKDAKVCLNCKFYDRAAHWECRETIPDPVKEKDRANFCDYFSAGGSRAIKGNKKTDEARDSFNQLFGDG
jgi:hypothetical protein